MRRVGLLLAQVLGAAWTLPNTLLGLLAGLAALSRGAKAELKHSALEGLLGDERFTYGLWRHRGRGY